MPGRVIDWASRCWVPFTCIVGLLAVILTICEADRVVRDSNHRGHQRLMGACPDAEGFQDCRAHFDAMRRYQ